MQSMLGSRGEDEWRDPIPTSILLAMHPGSLHMPTSQRERERGEGEKERED